MIAVTDIEIETVDVPARQTTEVIDEAKETSMRTLRAETIGTESVRTDTLDVNDEEASANGTAIEVPPAAMPDATTTNGLPGENNESLTRIADAEAGTDVRRDSGDRKTAVAQLPLLRSESQHPT